MSNKVEIQFLTAVLCILAATAGMAESDRLRLSLESIFSPDSETRVEFGGQPVSGLAWSPTGRQFLEPSTEGTIYHPPDLVDIDGEGVRRLFARDEMVAALTELPDFLKQDAEDLQTDEVHLNPKQDAILVERSGELFHYSFPNGVAKRLTDSPGLEEIPIFSPDGRYVSFVRDHDLYVIDVFTGKETALTHDGSPELFNGKLDWVYQEEVYGRGDFQAHWWSPDSGHLAFLQLDESPVGEFVLVDHLVTRSRTEVVHYPKAGDPNPQVRLGIVAAAGGKIEWVDISRYQSDQPLIVRVEWLPDSSKVVFHLQDREQTWMDINIADRSNGSWSTLVHETSGAFVDRDLTGETIWLKDGSFFWLSARDGYHHLFHFGPDGSPLRQITKGPWEVREVYGVDEVSGWVYFAASEHSPIEVHVYRSRLDGSQMEQLSETAGTHKALFNERFTHYLDTWSDFDTPPKVFLHRADGYRLRTVDDNPVAALDRLKLATVEFLQVPAPDGFVFEAALIKPPGFDPAKTYPVLQHNYGGPHAPTVKNAWGGSRSMWLRYLAQEGFLVWMCDNRSASAKGIWPTWGAHGRMGVVELQDLESCLAWLTRHGWADATRVALHGGSYGGFISSFALTHSRSFKAAIAFAPVTDWRLYDSIYTERYMGLPQDNQEGYAETSVIEAADQLHGEFLLIHGTMDDNVHLQNTIQLANALQHADKDFQLMLYPNSRHGVRDRSQIFHLYGLMTRFLLENL